MKLPSHLASRYSRMTDQEMGGDQAAAALIKTAMLNSGGRPGPIKMDTRSTKDILRPGVIQWDTNSDTGISFNMRKAKKNTLSAKNLNLDKLLHSRYAQQDIQQGRDVREFPSTVAAESDPEAIIKAAAKVEERATVLATKAKKTKDEALAGLGYYSLGEEAPSEDSIMSKLLILGAGVILGIFLSKKTNLF